MLRTQKKLAGLVAAALTICGLSAPAKASTFDLVVNVDVNKSGLRNFQKTAVQNAYNTAETIWESIITGYSAPERFLTGLTIDATVRRIDGRGNILGQAGPTYVYTPSQLSNPFYYTYSGIMDFDSPDVKQLIRSKTLLGVVLHEMAHVIGFGTLWQYNGLYVPGTGRYTAPNALASYRQEFAPGAGHVPVELDGGAGTANGHWDENWAGGSTDLMTGYYSNNLTFSDTTIHAFRDLGYTTVNTFTDAGLGPFNGGNVQIPQGVSSSAIAAVGTVMAPTGSSTTPVPLPPAFLALGLGLTALAGLRRRRRAA